VTKFDYICPICFEEFQTALEKDNHLQDTHGYMVLDTNLNET